MTAKFFLLASIIAVTLFSEEIPKASSSAIVETKDISDVLRYVKPNTLVLFDIDNTLIEPLQTLGSDQWFSWRIQYYAKKGYDPSQAVDLALMDWIPLVCLTEVKAVEPQAPNLVRRLQEEGFVVMGLTTRSTILRARTFQQLASAGIQLARTAPSKEEVVFLNPYEVIYKNGILFTSGTDKGRALFTFLAAIKEKDPQEVLFINDKRSNLEEVQQACKERGVPFIGLRYGYLDDKVRKFSEEAAEEQFRHISKFFTEKRLSGSL